jgi:hypothetical protein
MLFDNRKEWVVRPESVVARPWTLVGRCSVAAASVADVVISRIFPSAFPLSPHVFPSTDTGNAAKDF